MRSPGSVSLWLMLVLFAGPAWSGSATSTETPYLRIETGRHESTINAIASLGDAALVTVSDDKTARIWSSDFSAIRVLRPPIGPADEGALYSVAVSGEYIAVAGRIGDGRDRFAVALFGRKDGQAMGTIAGLPRPITALRFSPDSRVLAVGLQEGGIRFLDLAAHSASAAIGGYQGSVTGMDFDAAGRLVVAASDGQIRLYGPDHALLATMRLPNGALPWSVAFSPDARRIAIGDRRQAVVHVLDAATLRVIQELSGGADRQGSFTVARYSRDGRILFAAGSYKDAKGRRLIRRWDAGGHALGETAVAADTITDLLPRASDVVFTSAEPSIGRVGLAGSLIAVAAGRHIDFRDRNLLVSEDGTRIQVSGRRDAATWSFDVVGRELSSGALSGHLAAPAEQLDGVRVANWRNSHVPTLNGKPIPLDPAESARSEAVAPSGEGVTLGTDFYVRMIGASGELWRTVAVAPAWAVNVSRNGRFVVAGLGDGSIHWYRAHDGAELLTLFVEPLTRRWVLWTPDGFFDHDIREDGSPDGRALVGYQVNTADRRRSEFVEVGQLYPAFYRPDLVGAALSDTAAIIQKRTEQRDRVGSVHAVLSHGMPPAVRLLGVCGLSPSLNAAGCVEPKEGADAVPAQPPATFQTSSPSAQVRYRLVSSSGESGRVIITRNGAVIRPAIRALAGTERARDEEAQIPLAIGMNLIRITPVSATGEVEGQAESSIEIRVTQSAPVEARTDPHGSGARGARTLFLLSVGISRFSHPELDLKNAERDAHSVAALMSVASPPVYDRTVTRMLLNESATAPNILSALTDIAASAGPDDLVLIFFAGHGEQVDGKFYFAPSDFGTRDPATFGRAMKEGLDGDAALNELFRREGLGQDRLLPMIQAIPAARVAIVLDSCFSGSMAAGDAAMARNSNLTITNSMGHASGRFVLSSATRDALDFVPDGSADAAPDGQQHGLFTSFLLRALEGEADFDHAGRIDVYKLAVYTKREVERATAPLRQVQEPAYFFSGTQFFDLRAVGPTH